MGEFKVTANGNSDGVPFLLKEGETPVPDANDFLNSVHARGLSVQTVRAYAFDLLSFFRFLKEKCLMIEHLTPQHFIEFLLLCRKLGAAPRTVNRRLEAIKSFLNTQYDDMGDRLLARSCTSFYRGRKNNAMLGATYVKGQRRTQLRVKVPQIIITPLTPVEVKKFICGFRKYRDLALIHLMLFCGLRSCEVLNLQTTDIDFIDDFIRVRGKGGKERMLPLEKNVRTSLMRYLDFERPPCSHNTCFVVLKGQKRGRPMTMAGLRRLFRYHRRASSVPKAKAHRFRHTFATNMIREGVSLPVVQKLLGHCDIELTMAYVHMSVEDIASEYHRAIAKIQKNHGQ